VARRGTFQTGSAQTKSVTELATKAPTLKRKLREQVEAKLADLAFGRGRAPRRMLGKTTCLYGALVSAQPHGHPANYRRSNRR